MRKKLPLLLASSALLFASCHAINNPSDIQEKEDDIPEEEEEEEEKEFNEFDFFASSSSASYGRKMLGCGLYTSIKSFIESSAFNIEGKLSDGKLNISTIEDAESPRYNVSENIKDISGSFSSGLSDYSFEKNHVTKASDLIGFLNFDKLNADSTFSYQLSSGLKGKTTVTNESKIESGKLDFYLKDRNVYGDFSNQSFEPLLEDLAKLEDNGILGFTTLEQIALYSKVNAVDFLEDDEVVLRDKLGPISYLLFLPNGDSIGETMYNAVKDDAELKEELQSIFNTANLKMYSAIQKSDYYCKIDFDIDNKDDFITIIDYINDKTNEEEEFVPSDFAKELEENNITLSKIKLAGEIRLAKTGNIEIDFENDIKVQFKGEIDLSEVKDYSLGKVDVDASLECSANMNVNINFEKNKSYLDKLPNEEELATYHEINGELIREKIKELFSKVDELER